MSESEAYEYISEWNQISDNMMAKIRVSLDTSYESEKLYDILYGICAKYPLSNNTMRITKQ